MEQKDKEPEPTSLIAEFWGPHATHHGWTAVPNSLLMLQAELKVSPTDFCILLNVLMHQWPTDGKSFSFPAIDTIAKRIGVSRRTVQRGINKLESLGLIKKEQTSRNNRLTKGKNIIDTQLLKNKISNLSEDIIEKEKRKQKATIVLHSCPLCGAKAKDIKSAKEIFGFRKTIAGDIINSFCIKCRIVKIEEGDLF